MLKESYASMGMDCQIGGKASDEPPAEIGDLDADGLRTMPVPKVNSEEELIALFGRKAIADRFNDYILRTIKNSPQGIHDFPTWKSAVKDFNTLIHNRVPFNIKKIREQKRLGLVAIPALFTVPVSAFPTDQEQQKFIATFQDGPMRRWFHKRRCCVLPHIAISPFGAPEGRVLLGLQIAFLYSDTPEMFETMKDFYD